MQIPFVSRCQHSHHLATSPLPLSIGDVEGIRNIQQLTANSKRETANLTIHLSPSTFHLSPLTFHHSPSTFHLPPLTPHLSPLTSHLPYITIYNFSTVPCTSIHYLLQKTHRSCPSQRRFPNLSSMKQFLCAAHQPL